MPEIVKDIETVLVGIIYICIALIVITIAGITIINFGIRSDREMRQKDYNKCIEILQDKNKCYDQSFSRH